MVNSDVAKIKEIYGAAVPQDKGAEVVGVERQIGEAKLAEDTLIVVRLSHTLQTGHSGAHHLVERNVSLRDSRHRSGQDQLVL